MQLKMAIFLVVSFVIAILFSSFAFFFFFFFLFVAYTKGYRSPEAENGDFFCQKSDVYSFGKMLESLLDPEAVVNKDIYFIISKMTAEDVGERWNTEKVIEEVKRLEGLFSEKKTSPMKRKR